MPWIPLRIDQGRTSFSAADVLNSESRCTPSSSRMEQNKDYYRQTSASTMVSIARESTCDNSNIDLRTLGIKAIMDPQDMDF